MRTVPHVFLKGAIRPTKGSLITAYMPLTFLERPTEGHRFQEQPKAGTSVLQALSHYRVIRPGSDLKCRAHDINDTSCCRGRFGVFCCKNSSALSPNRKARGQMNNDSGNNNDNDNGKKTYE